jgi:predicted amidophosphoribosyltransferase
MPSVDAPGSTKTCPRCAETVKIAAQACKHCGFEFKDAPQQASYKGVPYTALSNGQVVVTVEGQTTTWPNLAAFQQHVDKKRAKLRL